MLDPGNPTSNLFSSAACDFAILKVPLGFDITGVSLPYSSINTTPNW